MNVFCEQCHDIVEYDTQEVAMEKVIKGKLYKYTGKEAFCATCGTEVFVSELRDSNLSSLDTSYRVQEQIVSVSVIEQILDMYDIGKRPLSLLLGWGEGTITRYLNGDMPTKQYSDILNRIAEKPQYFNEILESNKDRITKIAYERCKKSLGEIFGIENLEINKNKIDNVVAFLLDKCIDVTPLALQKLLYYAQSFNRVFNGNFLFTNDCEAWVHGPVYREIYEKYKSNGFNPIDEEQNFRIGHCDLTEDEIELLNVIVNYFGCYSGKILEKMTHVEIPWLATRKGLSEHESSDRIIRKDLIESYFAEIKEKYRMMNLSDIRDYSFDLFSKVN